MRTKSATEAQQIKESPHENGAHNHIKQEFERTEVKMPQQPQNRPNPCKLQFCANRIGLREYKDKIQCYSHSEQELRQIFLPTPAGHSDMAVPHKNGS